MKTIVKQGTRALFWMAFFHSGCAAKDRPPHGGAIECRGDCECDGTTSCVAGACVEVGRPAEGICGDPKADCPCNGGVCVDHCCILPDGGLATAGDPACTADAGP
jgi:hypothetical protein